MTERKPFMVRLREKTERQLVTDLANANDVSEAEVARRLLVPSLQLALRFGLNEVSAELRRQAQEAIGLGGATLRRKSARAKEKLPLKGSSSKHVAPKMQFG